MTEPATPQQIGDAVTDLFARLETLETRIDDLTAVSDARSFTLDYLATTVADLADAATSSTVDADAATSSTVDAAAAGVTVTVATATSSTTSTADVVDHLAADDPTETELVDAWVAGLDAPARNWPHDGRAMFRNAPTPQQTGPGQGTYSHARHGAEYWIQLETMIALRPDLTPSIIPAILGLSESLAEAIDDHDGRGYRFARYQRDTRSTGRFVNTDLNFLDEQLLGGLLARMAHTFKTLSQTESDFEQDARLWTDQLETWLQKWRARAGYGPNDGPFVEWDHPNTPDADAASNWQKWANGRHFSSSFTQPVRSLLHPFSASTVQYALMAGLVDAARARTFADEAIARVDYLADKAIENPNVAGGLLLPHNLGKPAGPTNSPDVATYWRLTAAYWVQLYDLGLMPRWLIDGVTRTLTAALTDRRHPQFMDGTGPATDRRLPSVCYLAPFDVSGDLAQIVTDAVDLYADPLRHDIGAGWNHHGSLLAALIAVNRQPGGVAAPAGPVYNLGPGPK